MKIKDIIIFFVICFFMFLIFQKIIYIEKISNSNSIDKVIYLNLDKRTDRRNEIEGELNKLDIDYIRFSAIENKNGPIGCCESHLEIIKLARKNEYKNVLIFEDDFTLLVTKEQFYEEMNKLFSSNVNFDVCLLAYNTNNLLESEYPFLYKIVDAQAGSGYIVNSSYYDTLIDFWEKNLAMFKETENIQYVCDETWKQLQKKDNWYCFKNRIGKQRPSHSDLQNEFKDYGGV